MDDLRLRAQQPNMSTGPTMSAFGTPPRAVSNSTLSSGLGAPGSRLSTGTGLPRRFADNGHPAPGFGSLFNPIGTRPTDQPAQNQPTPEQVMAMQKVQLIERKKAEYERLRERRRQFEVEMKRLDESQRREEQELAALTQEYQQPYGHQSEPTTPPHDRYESGGFPSLLGRSNRYSMSNVASPPSLYKRLGRASLLQSHHAGLGLQRGAGWDEPSTFRSMPGSRRNSDDEEKEDAVRQDPSSFRAMNARTNRYSMPVTSRTRMLPNDMEGLDQANTARFLFGNDPSTAIDSETEYMNDSNISGIDIALRAGTLDPFSSVGDWGSLRPSLSSFGNSQPMPIGSSSVPNSFRHSLDLKFLSEIGVPDSSGHISNPISPPNGIATPGSLLGGTFTSDPPTTLPGGSTGLYNPISRIGAGAMGARHNSQLGTDNGALPREQSGGGYHGLSGLHAGATPFGPSGAGQSNGQSAAFYPAASGFGPVPGTLATTTSGMIPVLSMGLQNMSIGNFQSAQPQQPQSQSTQQAHSSFTVVPNGNSTHSLNNNNNNNNNTAQTQANSQNGAFPSPPHARDSQARVIQSRRQQDSEANNKYNNLPLDSVVGQIYQLCKDQHGCRYLQRRLEEHNPEVTHKIWLETNEHVVELMTDPFGNYLCQKLLESCNEDERTTLISNASSDMVRIALNQHGTRALQKMIEFVHTTTQIGLIVDALRNRVVELIQDLNGNHVIQKCLNKLQPEDAQFIFDAVGTNCVDVGTHRHGCCVLQRCIDHANERQQEWLIARITEHARVLVQDPYGNYVVQYIIDLNEPGYTEPMVAQFRDCIGALSRHKFSSNVIEKCIRCASPVSKDMIVEELLNPAELDRCLRDGFANYVVQTALDYATPDKKVQLVEAIRPLLPSIRSTPHGRRIGGRINQIDNRGINASSDGTGGQIPLRSNNSTGSQSQSRNASSASTPGAGTISPVVGTIGSGLSSAVGTNSTATPRTSNGTGTNSNGFSYTNGLGLNSGRNSAQRMSGNSNSSAQVAEGETQWI